MTNAEKAAELLAPILARPESPAEHIRNALALLDGYVSDWRSSMENYEAARARLWKALEQLERP